MTNVVNCLFKILLVIGGYGIDDVLNSTEIYDPDLGSWRVGAALLPSPMADLIATSIDNRVLVFGK